LASGVPDLSTDLLVLHLDISRGEFDTNGTLGILFELILGVPEQQVRFPHARVPDQNYLEQVIVVLLMRKIATLRLERWLVVVLIYVIHFSFYNL
jgi:hypothetical protein